MREKQFCLHYSFFLQHKLGKICFARDHGNWHSIHLGNPLAGPDHNIGIIGQHNDVCVLCRCARQLRWLLNVAAVRLSTESKSYGLTSTLDCLLVKVRRHATSIVWIGYGRLCELREEGEIRCRVRK